MLPSPTTLDGIEQVDQFKCLGVIFQHSLSFESHVVSLLNQCSQRIYLLKMLRSQGIPPAKLHIIFRAIVVSRSLYCRPTPCLLGVLTDLVHSLAELMPFSSVHSDVAWLASSLLLMISCTGRPLGCLRKCVTQPIVSITSCHPSNLWIMFCVTVANPTSLPQCNYQSHKNSFINLCLFN